MKLQRKILLMTVSALALAGVTHAFAADFNIPRGDLDAALNSFTRQSGVVLMVPNDAIRGVHTNGIKGQYSVDKALASILRGTGFTSSRDPSGIVAIVREHEQISEAAPVTRIAETAAANHSASSVETVVVTSSKIKGNIQTVPIAITALSQEELTERQIAGGPDLVKEVPNLTFTKTNFTGYNIEIRGIGTQAISVATDPAVAVAFNDTPFIRNHFFEQEFFDVNQVEVLRGPQGTLFGRNANAGVVNVVSAKPTDQFEAMLSADWGNYSNRRYEGMINVPIVGDHLDLRIAGEWTKRDGYVRNETTGAQTDGRDLWSSRMTLRWKPVESVTADFIWEHFHEGDDRLRSGKQLCKTDPGPTSLTAANGSIIPVPVSNDTTFGLTAANWSQSCLPVSLYSKDAFEVPNGYSLGYVSGPGFLGDLNVGVDPYSTTTQSTNLRDIQSLIEPRYKANNDTLEYNVEAKLSPTLTFNSATAYNNDFLWSIEDFNRYDTSEGIFHYIAGADPRWMTPDPNHPGAAIICDPQLGCSSRLVGEDLSTETAWQFSQEFRMASDFQGPFNFSAGGNYLHYETYEKFYVFINSLTRLAGSNNAFNHPADETNLEYLPNGRGYTPPFFRGQLQSVKYIDPNPLTSLDDEGHNYFLSKNPYVLNSYALFGEAYYNLTKDLKLTGGIRWTDDQKHFTDYPSELVAAGYGYPSIGVVDQSWKKFSGRGVVNWTPKLDFTDQTMVYASFSHGYKAGGANPPGAYLLGYSAAYAISFPTHPLTFKPEYINAYEIGTKNTAADGALVFDADAFYYDYKGYQFSQIVDRTSVNINVDATIWGAELQTTWSPLPGLKFGFNGGYEGTRINNNQYFIDLMDRTAGQAGWVVMKPWVGQASNCVFPEYVAAAILQRYINDGEGNSGPQACGIAYHAGLDPVTQGTYYDSWSGTADPAHNLVPGQPYFITENSEGTGYTAGQPYGYPTTIAGQTYGLGAGLGSVTLPPMSYPGFDPASAPNGGQGFAKNVGGNQLPNAPHFTTSLTADYTMPVSANWAATLHGDFYWQSQFWARIFNDRPYDKLRGYSNANLALILTDASGWQVMGYVKNIFDTTAITGDFLYSDDAGLTTNVFLTDPRLYGVRITKHFDGGDTPGDFDIFSSKDGKEPEIWLQVGGDYAILNDTGERYVAPFEHLIPSNLPTLSQQTKSPHASFDWEGALSFQPDESDWVLKAGIRYGRSTRSGFAHKSEPTKTRTHISNPNFHVSIPCTALASTVPSCTHAAYPSFSEAQSHESERHTILDFTIGRNVGIGLFGHEGMGEIGAGIRVAQFSTRTSGLLNTDPHYNFSPNVNLKYWDVYNATTEQKRNFHGIGPELTWNSSEPVLGEESSGQVTLDWGVNAAMLFGRQKAEGGDSRYHKHCYRPPLGSASCYQMYNPNTKTDTFSRSKSVTVPNLGGYIGASVRYQNAKISFGYRADEFFNAMDGGQATAKEYNRGFYGPYMNLSLGFGG